MSIERWTPSPARPKLSNALMLVSMKSLSKSECAVNGETGIVVRQAQSVQGGSLCADDAKPSHENDKGGFPMNTTVDIVRLQEKADVLEKEYIADPSPENWTDFLLASIDAAAARRSSED